MYPYQYETVPYGCYCNQGFVQSCPSKAAQSMNKRNEFANAYQLALSGGPTHYVGQAFGLRYGWRAQQDVEHLIQNRSPSLVPFLHSFGCPTNIDPRQGTSIYDSLFGQAF